MNVNGSFRSHQQLTKRLVAKHFSQFRKNLQMLIGGAVGAGVGAATTPQR